MWHERVSLFRLPDWSISRNRLLEHLVTVECHEEGWNNHDCAIKATKVTQKHEKSISLDFGNKFFAAKDYSEAAC